MPLGLVESLVMDSLPIKGLYPSVQRVPRDVLKPRPIKRHGRAPLHNHGTACLKTKATSDARIFLSAPDKDYIRAAKEMENAAIAAARKEYMSEYRTKRLLVCYALDDLVGIGIVRKEEYVVWRPYSPVNGTFGNATIVKERSHGLSDGDVLHLAGYSLGDNVRIISVH